MYARARQRELLSRTESIAETRTRGALAVSAPNSDALTNCPDSMLDNAKPSPPFAALVAAFSNAPDEIRCPNRRARRRAPGTQSF